MDRSFFDKSVCREGNGNMKGAFAETVPAESVRGKWDIRFHRTHPGVQESHMRMDAVCAKC